jgi:hypothetical protein
MIWISAHKYSRSAIGIEISKSERIKVNDFIKPYHTWIKRYHFSVFTLGYGKCAEPRGLPQGYIEKQWQS